MLEELVVVSGKGGTGKTSLTASLAVLAGPLVVADCDVDAADLHLVLRPAIEQRHDFYSGNVAVIRAEDCTGCGLCRGLCRFHAIHSEPSPTGTEMFRVDPVACEGCGVCVRFCPVEAIDFPTPLCGEWMISTTRTGPMVHARLGVAAENSGKLVTTVRREARRLAEERGYQRILVDGPPGIGCPVIASVTGGDRVLAITEPTPSGEHDLERILALVAHFGIPARVCVNKWDLAPAVTERIEAHARVLGAEPVGRIRYDPAVTRAQMEERTVVELGSPAGEDIRRLWERLAHSI